MSSASLTSSAGRAGVEHALAGVNDRAARLDELLGDDADVGGIGRRAHGTRRGVVELALDLAVAHLGRQLDQDRTGFPVRRWWKARRISSNTRPGSHFRRPFGHRAEVLHRVERGRREAAADAVAGNEQYRNVVAEHLRRAGEAVLDPGPALYREHAGALAVGGAADAVGDAYPDALLAAYDRPDADLGAESMSAWRG